MNRLPSVVRGARAWAATVALCAGLAAALPAGAIELTGASPAGLWRTVSDVDGKAKAYVRIREENGVITGVIETILDPAKREDTCEKCDGARHGQRVQGLEFVWGLHRDGDGWAGGEILDPENGHIYSCKMSLSPDGRELHVRGFLGFSLLGRTQTWLREP
jgi:uncharacterized protein (DUF2147 family)